MFNDTFHSLSFVFLENQFQIVSSRGSHFPNIYTRLQTKSGKDSDDHKGWGGRAVPAQVQGCPLITHTVYLEFNKPLFFHC